MDSENHMPRRTIYRFRVCPVSPNDPRSAGYLHDAHALGFANAKQIQCQDLFFVEGSLGDDEANLLCAKLLSDPLTHQASWEQINATAEQYFTKQIDADIIEVALHPGVTDPVAEQIIRAAQLLGIQGRAAGFDRAALCGQRGTTWTDHALALLAGRLLANPTIHRSGSWARSSRPFPQAAVASPDVEVVSR
jgi:phosphoribosylformylglycinamidine (FGAM) synthase PurS component